LVQAGADLVLGSHSHRLQAAERIDGKWVVFSLGNFVFDAVGKDSNSVIERFTFRKQGITRETPIQVTIHQGFPTIPE
jgi:poly-gamma-glutamate synthesis protein (capsule biosynthesis protein)